MVFTRVLKLCNGNYTRVISSANINILMPEQSARYLQTSVSLQWCHNGHDGVSNHQPHDCLLNRLFKAQIKENIKASRHWLLCGEFTGEFPAQRASNAENVSIWWRHLYVLVVDLMPDSQNCIYKPIKYRSLLCHQKSAESSFVSTRKRKPW